MGKTLADYPELLTEWHTMKNGVVNPQNIKFMSNKQFWWVCNQRHEWQTSVSNRTRKRGCPYCAGQKVCFSNCLAVIYPEISKEWHPNKNSISPNDVVSQSNKKVWWQCKERHEWQAIISNRTNLGNNCPYCAGQKVCYSNSLAILRKDIAKEWHHRNVLTPLDVTVKSGRRVWWKCEKGHEWQAVISQRTSYNSGCPFCNQSKGEKLIKEFLESKNLSFASQAKFDDCKYKLKLPFDFLVEINDLKFLIEYNGEHHYKPIKWRGANWTDEKAVDKFSSIKFRDNIKREWCKSKNIPLLIIPYWEISNVEEIITNFIITF